MLSDGTCRSPSAWFSIRRIAVQRGNDALDGEDHEEVCLPLRENRAWAEIRFGEMPQTEEAQAPPFAQVGVSV